MFSEAFKQKHEPLVARYEILSGLLWGGFILTFVGLGFCAEYNEPRIDIGGTSGQILGTFGFFAAVITVGYWIWLRHMLIDRIWKEFVRQTGSRFSTWGDKQLSYGGPLLRAKTDSVRAGKVVNGVYGKYPFQLAEVITVYKDPSYKFGTDKPLEHSLKFTVLTVDTQIHTPHVFIDGLSQNKRTRHHKNLWALTKKVAPSERMQALEGDFSSYFDVYIARQRNKDLANPTEIDTLSILTPDVMLALRDEGHEFDYELADGLVHVIGEPLLPSVDSAEAYFRALDSVLTELLPQLRLPKTGKKYLKTRTTFMFGRLAVGGLYTIFYYFFWAFFCILIGLTLFETLKFAGFVS